MHHRASDDADRALAGDEDAIAAAILRGHLEISGITTVDALADVTTLADGAGHGRARRARAEGFVLQGTTRRTRSTPSGWRAGSWRGCTRTPGAPAARASSPPPPRTSCASCCDGSIQRCLPEYLPWVIAAVEAVCTDEFNIHGVLATTMPVGPVIVCNGPGTRAIGMNGGGNALGQGNRANLTIGRAVQLVVRNVGGGRPGEVDRATHGNPGKLSFCFAELRGRRRRSPRWPSAAASSPPTDTVTVFAGEGPRCIVDQKARTAAELANMFAACLRTLHNPKLVLGFDTVLVVGPEHARVFADDGWDRERLLTELHARLQLARQRTGVGRRRHRRRRARRTCTTSRCRSSAPTASCWCTPVAGPGCSPR